MKIKKIAQENEQRFIRFDKDARVEMFVDEFDIRSDDGYDNIILRKDINDEQKIIMLKELCVNVANKRLDDIDEMIAGIQVTIDGLSTKDINIDRINWDKLLHPEIVEDVVESKKPQFSRQQEVNPDEVDDAGFELETK